MVVVVDPVIVVPVSVMELDAFGGQVEIVASPTAGTRHTVINQRLTHEKKRNMALQLAF